MPDLSFEEFAGAGATPPSPPPGGGKSPSPANQAMSFEDFAGVKGGGDSVPFNPRAAYETWLDKTKQLWGGNVAPIADLALGFPSFLSGLFGGMGSRVGAMNEMLPEGKHSVSDLSPEQRKLMWQAGRAGTEFFSGPEWFQKPMQTGLKKLGMGEVDGEAKQALEWVSKRIQSMGERMEETTGGSVPAEAMDSLADSLMAVVPGLGVRGAKLIREKVAEMRDARKAAEPPPPTPQEEQARVPVQQQINDLLAIKTPEQRAAQARSRLRDVRQAFRAPEEGSDYGSIEESQFRAEERLNNQRDFTDHGEALDEAGERSGGYEVGSAVRSERIGQAEILRILQKPGHERSAEDLITLRQARKEGGNASPEALMLLGAAGIGAATGAVLDDDKLRGAMLGGVTGLAPALLMTGPGRVTSRFGQAGAVKGPGGMWHPEAVEMLSEPLYSSMVRGLEDQRPAPGDGNDVTTTPEGAWASKAVRNYLNRYAGTERDPLKDVEIQTADGPARWEKITDGALKGFPATEEVGRPGETVWNLGNKDTGNVMAVRDLNSALSHVGDYLRQNVKPEDLPRYDLVRAVKETAENDKRVAKQMEKAQQASTKDLPLHKEYPDGFRWVELKVPEKLTPEQAKTVRELTGANKKKFIDRYEGDDGPLDPKTTSIYEALGADGKPIKNTYTDSVATGGTPEEAWLAGRLAEEGNQMGHCVGGYCPSVASGESRIFSLRDPKGKSHVTVETGPTDRLIDPQVIANLITEKAPELHGRVAKILREADPSKDMAVLEKLKSDPDIKRVIEENYPVNIVQIKGKQNRAPNAEYLPYVQDFVKGGKWGEVGDLSNTGLWQYKGKYYTREEVNASEELTNAYASRNVPTRDRFEAEDPGFGRGQQGKASPELVLGLSAIGLGGLAGAAMSQDKGTGLLLGSLAGGVLALPGSFHRFTDAVKHVDWGLGVLSTRIANISPSVLMRARDYEMRTLTEAHEYLHRAVPFMRELDRVGGPRGEDLKRALISNDREKINQLMVGNRQLVDAWRETKNVLNELGERLAGQGRFKSMLDDYFPRLVKDYEGLKGALEQPVRERLEQRLLQAEQEALRTRGRSLSGIEQSAVINREIQGFYRSTAQQPGFTRRRSVDEVTKQLQSFYHTPQESLYAYVRGAVQDLELAKLFGKDTAATKRGSQSFINIDESIGNLVGRELREGRIDNAQANELIKLLKSRFEKGDQSPSRLIQSLRNVGNMGLLGSLVSAATQLGDVAMPLYAQGFRASIAAMAKQLKGDGLHASDFGLADHVAEEFVGATRTANALNAMLKYSGFTAIDRFGKTTMLNAAHAKLERQARNGSPALERKYGESFGDDFPALVRDLKAGRMTDNVRLALFSELSDFQPVSKLEVPQGYLEHPNGRIMYMLKTFMIKQADVIRRDAYNEIREGNVARGLKNLTSYAMLLGVSGAATSAIQNWLMGRPVSLDAGDVMENVLKTFGWGEYVRDKAKKSPVSAIANVFIPPYQMMDQILTRDPKAIQYIPLIGKLFYNWELGGREEAELRDARKAKKEGREYDLSERTQNYQERKREKARAARGG